ncbi:DUF952 domain-containing protein [Streptomyces sp. NPDC004288]
MIYHVVTPADWSARPEEPYVPASLAEDGFVHCSPDEATTLAVVDAFFPEAAGPLLVLLLDEGRLTARTEWEAADPTPPPGVSGETLFPHVFGPLDRAAVEAVLTVVRDGDGRATGLVTAG